jgi:hypothetical protein
MPSRMLAPLPLLLWVVIFGVLHTCAHAGPGIQSAIAVTSQATPTGTTCTSHP